MRKSTKILGALAVAGLVAVGGSAFTAAGLTSTAPATQFVGGSVSQGVTGATLAGVGYTFFPGSASAEITSVAVTFSGTADGLLVGATPTGGAAAAAAGGFGCTPVASNASTCTWAAGSNVVNGYIGLTSLAIAVTAP